MKWFVNFFCSVIKATNSGNKNFNMGLDGEDRSPKSYILENYYCYPNLYLFFLDCEAVSSAF